MFAPTFWPPTFYTPTYWTEKAGAAPAGTGPAGGFWGGGFWSPAYFATSYWPAEARVVPTDLRKALYAALLADPGVATAVGPRIFPGYRPQASGVAPQITFTVSDIPRVIDLDGQGGMGMAMMSIACWALSLADAVAAASAVRLCLGRVQGSLAGLTVTALLPKGEADNFDDPQDGTDVRPRSIVLAWRIHYREPKP